MRLFKKTDWNADNIIAIKVKPQYIFKDYKYITIKHTTCGARKFITTPTNGGYLTYLHDGVREVLRDWKKGIISNEELDKYLLNFIYKKEINND